MVRELTPQAVLAKPIHGTMTKAVGVSELLNFLLPPPIKEGKLGVGRQWFNYKCSKVYWSTVVPVPYRALGAMSLTFLTDSRSRPDHPSRLPSSYDLGNFKLVLTVELFFFFFKYESSLRILTCNTGKKHSIALLQGFLTMHY